MFEDLIDSRVLDLRDLSLEDFERLCQRSYAGELIPLDDCFSERIGNVYSLCQLLIGNIDESASRASLYI